MPKNGKVCWGVGVAAASGGLPKRFLDENWFWSYDWKVPEVFLVALRVQESFGKIGPPSK